MYFLAKAEYFQGHGLKGRLTRWFFTATGAIPVRRGMHRDAQAALDTALEVLRAGAGFRHLPGRDPFAGRTALPGADRGGLAGADDRRAGGAGRADRHRADPAGGCEAAPAAARSGCASATPLRFGPEYGDAGSAAARRRVTDEIMQAIGELSGQERAPGYNRPPQPE